MTLQGAVSRIRKYFLTCYKRGLLYLIMKQGRTHEGRCPIFYDQTKNHTDLKFGTHTPLDHNLKSFFIKSDPGSASIENMEFSPSPGTLSTVWGIFRGVVGLLLSRFAQYRCYIIKTLSLQIALTMEYYITGAESTPKQHFQTQKLNLEN